MRTEAQDTARAAVARKATKTRELRVPPYGRQAKRAMRKMGASHTTSEPRGKNERRGTQHETSLCTTTLTPEWRKRQAPPQREAVASGTSPGVCQVLFDAQTRALFRTLASAFFFKSLCGFARPEKRRHMRGPVHLNCDAPSHMAAVRGRSYIAAILKHPSGSPPPVSSFGDQQLAMRQ